MSLDIYIINQDESQLESSGVFVRRNGKRVELTLEEAAESIEGFEPIKIETDEVFSINITHNLNKMAMECGLYEAMWRPYMLLSEYDESFDRDEEYQFENEHRVICSDVIEQLGKGLEELRGNREKYEAYNPSNGWGNYDGLLRVSTEFYNACLNYPEGIINTSR